jgi:hypothetical protein
MPNAFYANQPDYIEKLNALWNAAFGDFSVPLSAKGDLITHDGSAVAVLPRGADGDVLTTDASEPTGLKWVAAGVGGGGVSSVAMSVPSFLSVAGSPITTSGTFAITLSGTALPVANGGTGGTSASAARTALGLVIGTNVQAQNSELQAIAGLSSAADKVPYFTGSGTAALADFTSLARTIAACTTAAQVRTAIGAASTSGGTETTVSLGELIASAFPKSTPVDTDQFGYADSETSDILVSFTWLDVKTALKMYFDTLYGSADAEDVAVTDSGGYFTGTDVEAVLQEIGAALDGQPHIIPISLSRAPTADEIIVKFTCPVAFTLAANLSGSKPTAADVASTASKVFAIKQNGTSVATLTYAAAGTVPTLATTSGTAKSFAVDDIFSFHAPSSADTTLSGIYIALLGMR